MADTKISDLSAAAALVGTETIPAVQSAGNVKATVTQIGTFVRGLFTTTPATIAEGGTGSATAANARTALGLGSIATQADATNNASDYVRSGGAWARRFMSVPPISGNWFHPIPGMVTATGITGTLNTIYFSMLVLTRDTLITDLGIRSTSSTAGNIQLAIYGADAAYAPTGAALVSTGAIAVTTTAGTFSAAVTASATLNAGIYWAAVNSDTTGLTFIVQSALQGAAAGIIGSSALLDVSGGATLANFNYSAAQTYGTWPTSPTVTKQSGSQQARAAAVFYKAG